MAQTRQYQDFTGQQIGFLKIIKRLEDNLIKPNDKIRWEAQCICSTIVNVSSRQLRRAPNRSCGCQWRIHAPLAKRDPKHTNINNLYSNYVKEADGTRIRKNNRKRLIGWALTKEQFCILIFGNCHYCGIEPNREHNVFKRTRYKKARSKEAQKRHEDGKIFVHGIDRIDPTRGYSIDNCVSCCTDCNYGKHTKTTEEFLTWINRVHKHQNQHD